ncbi:MAG: hypothetical protein JXA03_04155 [Bacteroidales bacterium]|nr:hypothetical protein [Bacteroidales bacterium]
MRTWLILLAVSLVTACAVQEKNISGSGLPDFADSSAFELLITEPGFDYWFHAHRLPQWFHYEEYYSHFNTLSVNEWNQRFLSFRSGEPCDFYIDYNPREEYGLEIEYRLYYYFRFMEDKYGISLLTEMGFDE